MKSKLTLVCLVLLAAAGGYLAAGMGKPLHQQGQATNQDEEPEILYWVAPMDANFRRDGPGKSPMGMDLVPVYAGDEAGEEGAISINPAITQNLGLRLGMATLKPFQRDFEAVGSVAWSGNDISKVYARTEGWLESFELNAIGQTIRSGETIFGIYAPQLVAAQEEYLSALKSGSRTSIRASYKRLLALGVTESQITKLEKSKAAQRLLGYVADEDVVVLSMAAAKGSYVTAQTEIATFVDTRRVWVLAEVHESAASGLAIGQAATVIMPSLPGRSWKAEISYIYPELVMPSRTVKVRLELPNEDRQFRAGMLAQVAIQYTQESALQIPKESVIRAKGGNRVVVSLGAGSYVVRPVLTGAENGNSVVVLDGLKNGDEVVTSAQFLLDAEANGYQALERLRSLRSASGTAEIWGFPRWGQIRLYHDAIAELDWGAMNMVFEVADSVDLMPFNKEDRVRFEIRETLSGGWEVTSINHLEAES